MRGMVVTVHQMTGPLSQPAPVSYAASVPLTQTALAFC